MSIEIKPAEIDNIPAIIELMREFAEFEKLSAVSRNHRRQTARSFVRRKCVCEKSHRARRRNGDCLRDFLSVFFQLSRAKIRLSRRYLHFGKLPQTRSQRENVQRNRSDRKFVRRGQNGFSGSQMERARR